MVPTHVGTETLYQQAFGRLYVGWMYEDVCKKRFTQCKYMYMVFFLVSLYLQKRDLLTIAKSKYNVILKITHHSSSDLI